MILYHGSNVCVTTPRLFRSDRRADFGTRFYLTTSIDQAGRWAQLVSRRRRRGSPLVSVFEADEEHLRRLDVLRFESPTVDWLAFVGANRRGEQCPEHDVVIGPVANDNTMPTLRLNFSGDYTEEEAIRRLMPQKLRHQLVFKTSRALNALAFREVMPL